AEFIVAAGVGSKAVAAVSGIIAANAGRVAGIVANNHARNRMVCQYQARSLLINKCRQRRRFRLVKRRVAAASGRCNAAGHLDGTLPVVSREIAVKIDIVGVGAAGTDVAVRIVVWDDNYRAAGGNLSGIVLQV